MSDVVESSNLMPMTELSATVENVEAVLEDGSDAQTTFVQDLKDTIVVVLGVDAGSIKLSRLRRAENIGQGVGGRRRTQTAGEVTFNIQVTGPDPNGSFDHAQRASGRSKQRAANCHWHH